MKFDIGNIISAKEFKIALKATIHSSGKLGFTEATSDALRFDEHSSVKFAIDTDDSETLYLINGKWDDEDAFPVRKVGAYFNINAKGLFDRLGLDYTNNRIAFDLIRVDESEYEVYRLKMHKSEKKKK